MITFAAICLGVFSLTLQTGDVVLSGWGIAYQVVSIIPALAGAAMIYLAYAP